MNRSSREEKGNRFSEWNYLASRIGIMDRIVITCKQCGRPLSALPTMKSRRCAACGATTKVLAFQREQAVPVGEVAEKVAAKAKRTQFDPGKTVVVKRRAARPVTDDEGGDA
jgi:LSD1 subclass zinc finger protein